MIADSRKLSVARLTVVDGEVILQSGALIWQEQTGEVVALGLWKDTLVPDQDDLRAQAEALEISALEWLKRKLSRSPYLKVTVL